MIGSKVSASSSTIDSDFDLVSAHSMINTLKLKKCIDSPSNKENFLTSKSKASSSQNNPKKLPTQLNKETNSKDNAVLLQKLKQAKKALAKYQEDKNRLESELTQNRSLMAQILSCQITAKNKTRVKNSSRPKEYFPSDDRCVGIKTFDSLAWIPLLERLEEEQVDLFVQVPPPMIPRLLDGKGGLISQTVFKSLISLTVNEHQNSSIATPPFCIILLPFSHVMSLLMFYLLEIALDNLTLLLLDEADLLIHDVDFVRCFIEIQSSSPSSYRRTLMFSRTLDNQTSPLLSDILKIGYKTLLIGERAFEMSHSSLNYSEQSEGRLIDFDEESSVSENELNQTGYSNELAEQKQGDDENIHDVANLSTLNDEENDIIVSNSELSQPSETNELSENVEEQNLISNKDSWPLEFINIRPPPPPAMLPFYMENDEEINFNEQGTSYQIYNNIENDQHQHGLSSFFEIEEQNLQRNGLLIDIDQRQSTSTLGEAYQSCLASFKSTSTHTSISNLSSFTNANVFSRHNQMLNNSSTRQLQVKRYRARSYGKAKIGKLAPEFTADAVVDSDFKTVSLSDYKGKYVVLFFYPLDFTFVCPTEIIAFSERSGDFTKINVQLLACSTDSKFSHFEWINKPRKEGGLGEMKIPVLSDRNMKIARDYGVLKEDEGIAYRGLFIIDPKGILRQITINDLPVGRSVDETLRLVQAFQYTDKHGEVCPANWKPGSDTIKPDPNKSKEYFGKQ
uniref:thioredoxin-dependent peroxiredoxin n=1 Tax=Meloidogyne enterolobii TaxID=390850 RepID=A0A6V7XT32_MELEN|nr:unnamed protein product [Meloidogyne enterolobii]